MSINKTQHLIKIPTFDEQTQHLISHTFEAAIYVTARVRIAMDYNMQCSNIQVFSIRLNFDNSLNDKSMK